MTEQMEQMIFNEGYRRGKADRPKGEWERTNKDLKCEYPMSVRWYRCSVCRVELDHNKKTNYCPYCGADMRGEDNETD